MEEHKYEKDIKQVTSSNSNSINLKDVLAKYGVVVEDLRFVFRKFEISKKIGITDLRFDHRDLNLYLKRFKIMSVVM